MPTAVRETSAQWLSSSGDVLAHLCFVAAEVDGVVVEANGRVFPGTLGFPLAGVDAVEFTGGALVKLPQLAVGQVVRLRYLHARAWYTWLSAVVERPKADRWCLAFPSTIERTELRIAPRHAVGRAHGFRLRADLGDGRLLTLPVHDLSTAGLAFRMKTHHPIVLVAGSRLAVTVCLPDRSRVPALVEVRHARAHAAPDERVIGCRFVGMAAEDVQRIALALA